MTFYAYVDPTVEDHLREWEQTFEDFMAKAEEDEIFTKSTYTPMSDSLSWLFNTLLGQYRGTVSAAAGALADGIDLLPELHYRLGVQFAHHQHLQHRLQVWSKL